MERRKKYGRVSDSAYVTAGATIFKGRARIGTIVLSSGADASTLSIYDGVDTTSKKIHRQACIADHTHCCEFMPPLNVDRAITLVFTGTTPTATICWEVIPKSVDQ